MTLERTPSHSRTHLDPLREHARTMQAELDARNEHVVRLEEENRRWQERNIQLLTKVCLFYDRIDPTEFQLLEDEIESLKGEKSAWETERVTHTSPSVEQQEKVIIAN